MLTEAHAHGKTVTCLRGMGRLPSPPHSTPRPITEGLFAAVLFPGTSCLAHKRKRQVCQRQDNSNSTQSERQQEWEPDTQGMLEWSDWKRKTTTCIAEGPRDDADGMRRQMGRTRRERESQERTGKKHSWESHMHLTDMKNGSDGLVGGAKVAEPSRVEIQLPRSCGKWSGPWERGRSERPRSRGGTSQRLLMTWSQTRVRCHQSYHQDSPVSA